jgi:penicillin-binding protein 1A
LFPYQAYPVSFNKAFIAAEDSRFYKHQGIDFFSIIRAFIKNIEAGTIVQGGSTITQQVTKSFLLTPERSYERKIKEAILAYRIDKTFTKEEVLYLYLNQIYLGHGAYGVEAAAENYFGKSVSELNLAECAILAGLPQAPSRYSPFRFPERAKQRQIYVLNRMLAEGFINNTEVTEAIDVKMDIKPRRNWYIEEVPIYTEHIRRYVEKKYGREALYNQGLKIYAAVNIEMQKAARKEIEKGLRDLDRRRGYRGPEPIWRPRKLSASAMNANPY